MRATADREQGRGTHVGGRSAARSREGLFPRHRIGRWAAVVPWIGILGACSTGEDLRRLPVIAQVSLERVSELRHGMDAEDVRRALGCRGLHQFTVRFDGSEYEGLGFHVEGDAGGFIALFRDGVLAGCLGSPEWGPDGPVRPPSVSVEEPHWIAWRLEHVAAVGEEVERLAECRERLRTEGPQIPIPLLSLLVIPALPRLAVQEFERTPLRERFDGGKIAIGDSRESVEAIFGTPGRVGYRSVYGELHVYGPGEALGIINYLEPSKVVVWMRDDRVRGVFSRGWIPVECVDEAEEADRDDGGR